MKIFELKTCSGDLIYKEESSDFKQFIKQMVDKNLDMSNADLKGKNLSNCDLSDIILTGADLSNTDLCGSDMSNCDLSFANLSGADFGGPRKDVSGKACMPYETRTILKDCILDGARINWNSNSLIAHLIWRNAGEDQIKKAWAGMFAASTEWTWKQLIVSHLKNKEWIFEILAKYITENDEHPIILEEFRVK